MELNKFITNCYKTFPVLVEHKTPWEITDNANEFIEKGIKLLGEDYEKNGNIAIHKTAKIEEGVILKDAVIIGKDCFIGAGAYLRGGVFLDENVVVGPKSEIKASFIFRKSRIAHFNFIGNSIIGEDVNFEAGAVIANYFNEREEGKKEIKSMLENKIVNTGTEKFGALVGDGSRIGANAVLNPGSILLPGTIVGRLELYDQIK
ncbi:MAG: Transferase, LpxA family [Candidatus Falkowbacteria bacterium GW2011_GWF2_39_8]|uniref:Transferase, LpxA family n=1 Tax=Candidatus Falkowbacteria bacterium GW2011_GWF2_39_8 TaxID=1618642 RepID=A0A0G0SCL2_9BACT|nr:MAG: Transferase, LpxA family [Candidatus Falkowbacteria bacterium GW2011_GWF2_39_8]